MRLQRINWYYNALTMFCVGAFILALGLSGRPFGYEIRGSERLAYFAAAGFFAAAGLACLMLKYRERREQEWLRDNGIHVRAELFLAYIDRKGPDRRGRYIVICKYEWEGESRMAVSYPLKAAPSLESEPVVNIHPRRPRCAYIDERTLYITP